MFRTKPKSTFLQGALAAAPFLIVIAPFGALFGVVASEAGLDFAQVMGFTVLVIAGASQFAAVAQMKADAPTIMVIVTALAVNLRMAMYSASLTPYLGKARLWQRALAAYLMVDQAYVLGISKYEAEPDLGLRERLAFYAGVMSLITPLWFSATVAGALAGGAIPPGLALDFAVPITFLAMVAPMLRTLAHLAAALTSIGLALLLAGLPNGTGLIVAALAAMAVGAGVEMAMERGRA